MVSLSKARTVVLVGIGAFVTQVTAITVDPGSMTSTDTVSSMTPTDTVSSVVSTDSMRTDSVSADSGSSTISSDTISTISSDSAMTTASTESGIIFTDPFPNTISSSSIITNSMSTNTVSSETMSTSSVDANTISTTVSSDSQSETSQSMTETASESQSTITLSIETSSDSQSTSTVGTEMSTESSSAPVSISSDASMSSNISSTEGQGMAIASTSLFAGSQSSVPISSTETASSSASSTETIPRPTITVTSRVVRSFAAIFDEDQVPDGTGSYVNLTVYDTTINVTRRAENSFVAQYLGCYLFNGLTSPFTADDSRNFIGNADASDTASGCAAACAGSNYALSANNQGDCFCGNELDAADLSRRPDRSSCSAACAGNQYESCGGGDRVTNAGGALLGGRNAFFGIIETVNAAEADIVVLDEINSITSTIAGTASATNTESTSSAMTDRITGTTSTSTDTASSMAVLNSSGTGTETGTSSSAVSSPTNGVLGVQSISQAVIAGVLNDGGAAQAQTSANQGDVSGGDSINGGTTSPGGGGFRLPTGGYLGGQDADFNPGSCSGGASFNLTAGELGASDGSGARVAADPSVDAYIPLAVSPADTGSGSLVAGTFSSVDGVLHWSNQTFYGGEAGFCQVASGEIYATFAEAARRPQGCVSISLTLYRAEQCQNGTLVDAALVAGPSTTPAPSGPRATTTSGGSSGLASMSSPVPSSQNIFPIGASPTGASCVETDLLWPLGPTPTFIRG